MMFWFKEILHAFSHFKLTWWCFGSKRFMMMFLFKEIFQAFSHFKLTWWCLKKRFFMFLVISNLLSASFGSWIEESDKAPTDDDLRQKVKNHYSLLLFTDYCSLFTVHQYCSLCFLCLFKGGCPYVKPSFALEPEFSLGLPLLELLSRTSTITLFPYKAL